jgi:hypothetical protein
MKRLLIIIFGFAAALLAQSTGAVSGGLKSTSGAPVAGAIVAAYLQGTTSTNGSFPPVFNTLTGSDGSFALNGLLAGTYVLCAQEATIGLLDPCSWSTKPTSVTVTSGGSVSGVSLVAQLGVALNIRVNDPKGLTSSNPSMDDVLVGVKAPTGPPVPAQLISKDSSGKMLLVLAPAGLAASIVVYSANFSLADNQGDSFSTPNVMVTVNAPSATAAPATSTSAGTSAGTAASTANLTLTIQGQASH